MFYDFYFKATKLSGIICFILKLPSKYKITSGLSASVGLKLSCYQLPYKPIRKLTVSALGN